MALGSAASPSADSGNNSNRKDGKLQFYLTFNFPGGFVEIQHIILGVVLMRLICGKGVPSVKYDAALNQSSSHNNFHEMYYNI